MAFKSFSFVLSVLGAVACLLLEVKACGETLLQADFNNNGGSWSDWKRSNAENDFPVGLRYTKGIERADAGEGALRIRMPKGGVGPGGTGMLMRVNLPRDVESATLSYRVKFDDNYDWTAGGKLPGLCDSFCPTGCKDMNKEPGWSSRVMFRKGGAMESYMYYPHMKDFGTCGKSWLSSAKFESNKWHEVTLYIKLNSNGQSNGIQKLYLDGQQVLSKDDVKFRPGSGNKIHQLKFEAFHGGKSDVFKPSKDQHVQFDDFLVKDGFCPPGGSGSTFQTESDNVASLKSNEVQSLDSVLGRKGGNEISSNEGNDGNGDQDELDDNDMNDEMIDDDDGDADPDCGDGGEPVCTMQQIKDHGRKYECDHGYMNNGRGKCVTWKP